MKKGKALLILLCMIAILIGVTYVDIYGVDEQRTGSASDIKLGLDLAGGVSITYQVAGNEEPDPTDMADTISKLEKRVWNYSTEAIVYQEGTNRINIEIPGVSDANAILQELGKPGSLYFIAETDAEGNYNYSGHMEVDEQGNTYPVYTLNYPIEQLVENGSVVLVGTDVKDARAVTTVNEMQQSVFAVDLTMTEEGTVKFADATRNAYQKGETLAIYYDGQFMSVPRVNGVFTDGNAQISPMDSPEEAEALASTIRIGGLKLELEELHSKVVGAQLGEEAIATSLKAGAIGLLIVIVFMIAIYFIPGLASGLALLLYVALIVLLLTGFNDVITLTLSGVAGIILSIGMAVDANVIVFARIREEIAAGSSVKDSIKTGFSKALSAIVDGNITTLIAAAVLFFLAPGTIKGFAQTLALGIALSMFTALVLTRLILEAFYALGFKDAKWYGKGREMKTVDFLGRKKVFFGVSLAIIAAGFVVMGVNKVNTGAAMNYSLEFKGGTATTVTFNEYMTLEEANTKVVPVVEQVTGEAVQVQNVQDTNEIIFKTNTLSVEQRDALDTALMEQFGVSEDMITSETISSTMSDEMKTDTILAVVVAIVGMLIYIKLRFKDMRFGISSIVALVHDVLVVIAFYAATKISVGNTFIACMLTIVGYSVNATIVIFDRIRENMDVMETEDVKDVVNKSITQTLSRSIFTSLTTFIMVACLYVLGVTSIKDFALPLMVGIVAGAYSSVCLAGSVWFILRGKITIKEKEEYDIAQEFME